MTVSDPTLQLIVDKQQLLEVILRACRAVDRSDGELLLSCYWEDGYDDHGNQKGSPEELLAYLQKRTMVPSTPPMQHAVSNSLFDVQGNTAFGESYVESRVVAADGTVARAMARYVDRFERRGSEWRILHRRVILESARPGFDTSSFVSGTRGLDDPSYDR